MITIKSAQELDLMREGGKKLAAIVAQVAAKARPGLTTWDLELEAVRLIEASGGTSSFLGFHGYPAVSCISVNDEVVHGIPNKIRRLEDGDIVGVDIGLRYNGFCTDHATTVVVGKANENTKRLLERTEKSLYAGIEAVKPGARVGDISAAIQQSLAGSGFGIVRDLTGHGIGQSPHEEPSIPNFGTPGTGPLLREGMVLAIEPMVTEGSPKVMQLDDDWTIATIDGSLAAHFEHTVAVTATGYEILTREKS